MSERKQAKRRKNARQNRKKGIIAAVIGTSLLIAFLGILVPPVSLSAVGIFPGIQTIVDEKVSAKQKYCILEIVPDGATGEIGYLAVGSEPEYFQDRLSRYIEETQTFVNTSENRKNYILLLSEQLKGRGLLGEDKPLDYEEYSETYFPENREGASWIYFPEDKYETLELAGTYSRNTSNNGMYRSNIVRFTYDEHGDYSVSFKQGVKQSEEAPYNQPYEITTDGTIVPVAEVNEDRLSSYYYIDRFSYEGTASSSSNYTAVLDTDKPYSYVGTKGDFDFYPKEKEEETASPSETEQKWKVEIGQVAYTGGIINRDWFKSKILNASNVDDLDVEVVTVTESKLADADLSSIDFLYICGDTSASVSEISSAVIHEYGVGAGGKKSDCAVAVNQLMTMVTDEKLPCMIDSTVWEKAQEALNIVDSSTEESDIYRLVRLAKAADSVNGNIYCVNTKSDEAEAREAFFTDWSEIIEAPEEGEDPYEEVRQLIRQENMFRSGADVISKDISKITVIQYIINCRDARVISEKEELRVLDIEPAMGVLYEEGASIPKDSAVLTKEKLAEWTGVSAVNISIVRMTSAEFIGKTEDLNTQYDLVYFGLGYNGDFMNRDNKGNTVYNDSYMDGLVYTHVGDTVLRPSYLAGLLDTDYVANDTGNYLYDSSPGQSNDAYGYRNTYSDTMKKLVTQNTTLQNYPKNRYNTVNVTVGNVGVYRYSGNDITKTKLSDLKEYVGAKYPILFGEDFLKADGSLNDERVDNSSILYELMGYDADSIFFVQDGKITRSGSTEAAIIPSSSNGAEQQDFITYISMPKPKLVLFSPNSSTLEVPEETTVAIGEETTAENSYGNKVMLIDTSNSSRGIYTIRMRFRLDSSVDADSSTRYIPKLYLDLNADGKFVENGSYSDLIRDISIRDESGAEAQKRSVGEEEEYLLKRGTVYTLEKEIPSEYRGMLTWKLELCQDGNDMVRASKIGYTVVSRGNTVQNKVETVTVAVDGLSLTAYSNNIRFETANGVRHAAYLAYGSYLDYNINVKEAGKYQLRLKLAMQSGDTRNIKISVDGKEQATVEMTSSGAWDAFVDRATELEFAEAGMHKLSFWFDGACNIADFSYRKNSETVMGEEVEVVKVLQIMGDTPDWGIWELKTDNDIRDFIEDFEQKEGIRFELYTTTASEFSRSYRYKENGADDDEKNIKSYSMLIFGFQDSYTDIENEDALNGIDQFINSGKSVLFTHDNTSFVNVDGENSWRAVDSAGNISNLSSKQRYWGYNINQRLRDILGMDRFGVTYNEHTAQDKELSKNRSDLLKQGQLLDITEEQKDGVQTFIGSVDEDAGGIATRGLTSAELGTDKDIAYVARSNRTQSYGETQGYSVGSINFNYGESNEVKYNSFNQYMELNVFDGMSGNWRVRMGQLENMKATQLNDGQITHYPYEIGDEINITSTHYQWWQLNLDQDFDQDDESDIVVWYCLSSDTDLKDDGFSGTKNMYTESPNDARNNYYIYSIGNIMYSGVGHATVTEINEKKLFFNTIVAAYKIGVKSPSVTVLESEDRNAKEKTVEYLPFDESMGINGELLDDEISFYYTVSDPNLVSSTKKIYADYSFGDGTTIANTKQNNDVYITTEPVGGKTLSAEGSLVKGLRSGTVYKATIHNLDSTTVKNQLATNGAMSIQIRVQSAFTYYGDTYGLETDNKTAPSASTSITFQKRTLFDLD